MSRSEKDKSKLIQDKCQNLLTNMLRDEDNKYCVDCDAKGPRWASWNLGIFLCIRCAGIHRNLGVHISKVKSVNLDTWTPEQVVSLQQMGNSRARAVYEANLPDSFRRPQTDSALENFIRAKYEQKKYIAREWVPPTLTKVNWDKEIEEEERLKRKKNSKSTAAVSTPIMIKKIDTPIPAPLPKPQSSPKNTKHREPKVENNTTDLLGLDTPSKETTPSIPISNGDEIFGELLSADTSQQNKQKRTEEEDNFFNQTNTVGGNEKKKLDKNSILALYAQQPTLPAPGNIYPQGATVPFQHQQITFQQYQNKMLPNGYNTPLTNQTLNNFGAANPFYNMASTANSNPIIPNTFNNPNNLANQMSSLNLQSSYQTNQQFPTNLWQ